MKPFGSVGVVYRKIVLVTVTFYIARKLALIYVRHVEYLYLIMAEFVQEAAFKDINYNFRSIVVK